MRRMKISSQGARARTLLTELAGANFFAAKGFSLANGRATQAARNAFQRAFELDPSRDDVRAGQILVERGRVPDAGLTPREQSIAAAWRLARAKDFASIRALESGLSEWRAGDILYEDALRLRVAWRLATGEATHAREALEMNSTILYGTRTPRDYLQRAQAAQLAHDTDSAWGALEELGRRLRTPSGPVLARQGLEIARRLPDHERAGAIRMSLRPRRH
jgi:hypothetical protein